MAEQEMLVVTSPEIPGRKIVRTLGLVSGNTIRARHVGKDIMACLLYTSPSPRDRTRSRMPSSA